MFESIKKNSRHTFYPVKIENIHKVEEKMGILIPELLVQFYLEVGYGFLETNKYNINRIMGPSSLEEFYFGTGQFQNLDEAEGFMHYMKDRLYFFEVNESLFLSIGTASKNIGMIYYYDKVIADDINEFFKRYLENERYFLELD